MTYGLMSLVRYSCSTHNLAICQRARGVAICQRACGVALFADLELGALEGYALNATANLIFRVSTCVVPLVEN